MGMVLPTLFLGKEEIPWCDVVTDLGRFDRQFTNMYSRVYAPMHRLRLLKFLTPKRVSLKLCKTLLLPYFLYCDVICSRIFSIDRIDEAFNSCLIFVVMTAYPQAEMNSWVCLYFAF
jgi:hypothetical protein